MFGLRAKSKKVGAGAFLRLIVDSSIPDNNAPTFLSPAVVQPTQAFHVLHDQRHDQHRRRPHAVRPGALACHRGGGVSVLLLFTALTRKPSIHPFSSIHLLETMDA